MNTDIIETAAQTLYEEITGLDWDAAGPGTQRLHLTATRIALGAVGVELSSEPPPPVGQMRRHPDGMIVAICTNEVATYPWCSSDGVGRDDNDVRDWTVLVPETDLDEMRAERDRLAARVAELEVTEGCAVDADALAQVIYTSWKGWLDNFDEKGQQALIADTIRKHLPAATRPVLPEGHVAVDLRDIPEDSMSYLAKYSDSPGYATVVRIAIRAVRAELARRGAGGGE